MQFIDRTKIIVKGWAMADTENLLFVVKNLYQKVAQVAVMVVVVQTLF